MWRQAPQDLTSLPPPKKSSGKVKKAIECQEQLVEKKEKMEPFDMASLQLSTPPGPLITAEALLTMAEFSAVDLIRSIAQLRNH